MSTVSLILFVLAGACLVWQIALLGTYFAIVAAGKRPTDLGMGPLALGVVLAIVGIVLR